MAKQISINIQKVNSGVRFTIINARGKPVIRSITERDRRALFSAYEWYCGELNKVALAHDICVSIGASNAYEVTGSCCTSFLFLEPWGFAEGTFDAPVMGNSGSTATDSRARRLLCYQAPLDQPGFKRVINI